VIRHLGQQVSRPLLLRFASWLLSSCAALCPALQFGFLPALFLFNDETNVRGAPAGDGAIYTWSGNNEVGEGRMAITESRPSDLIRINLEFFKPFAATNTTEFTLHPEATKPR
jgi:hypothetical protein